MSEISMKEIRSKWRSRLIDAELPEEVVDAFLAGVEDKDLVRMKDMSSEEFMTSMRQALDVPEADSKVTVPEMAQSIELLSEAVAGKVQGMLKDVEIEVPELAKIVADVAELKETVDSMSTMFKEFAATFNQVAVDDTTRIKQVIGDMSPAQRIRLRAVMDGTSELETAANAAQFRSAAQSQAQATTMPTAFKAEPGVNQVVAPTTPEGFAIYDSDGRAYASLTDMAVGNPVGDE